MNNHTKPGGMVSATVKTETQEYNVKLLRLKLDMAEGDPVLFDGIPARMTQDVNGESLVEEEQTLTTFNSALGICGLSEQEAATYLGVSLASVNDWRQGKSAPPLDVWKLMADLWQRIEDAAAFGRQHIIENHMGASLLNSVTAQSGTTSMPSGADGAAGALAVLSAVLDQNA